MDLPVYEYIATYVVLKFFFYFAVVRPIKLSAGVIRKCTEVNQKHCLLASFNLFSKVLFNVT